MITQEQHQDENGIWIFRSRPDLPVVAWLELFDDTGVWGKIAIYDQRATGERKAVR